MSVFTKFASYTARIEGKSARVESESVRVKRPDDIKPLGMNYEVRFSPNLFGKISANYGFPEHYMLYLRSECAENFDKRVDIVLEL